MANRQHNEELLRELRPLDIVELESIFNGVYCHYGINIGNGRVIHRWPSGDSLDSGTLALAVVREDDLLSIAKDCLVEKGNTLDGKSRPLAPEEAVNKARSKLDKVEVPKHNAEVLHSLKPGDIVKFCRLGGAYYHYGIFAGDEKIIHRGSDSDKKNYDSFFVPTGDVKNKAVIREDRFWDVAAGCRADCDNMSDQQKTVLDSQEIVQRARSKIGEKGYNLLTRNCEHFATWCRYGIEESEQAEMSKPKIAIGNLALILVVLAPACLFAYKLSYAYDPLRNFYILSGLVIFILHICDALDWNLDVPPVVEKRRDMFTHATDTNTFAIGNLALILVVLAAAFPYKLSYEYDPLRNFYILFGLVIFILFIWNLDAPPVVEKRRDMFTHATDTYTSQYPDYLSSTFRPVLLEGLEVFVPFVGQMSRFKARLLDKN